MSVTFTNLTRCSQLNGQTGHIVGWKNGRFQVSSSYRIWSVRCSNLALTTGYGSIVDAYRKSIVLHVGADGEVDAFGFWLDPTLSESALLSVERTEVWELLKTASTFDFEYTPPCIGGMEGIMVDGPQNTSLMFLLTSNVKTDHSTGSIVVELAWRRDFTAHIHAHAIHTYVMPCMNEIKAKLKQTMQGKAKGTLHYALRAS